MVQLYRHLNERRNEIRLLTISPESPHTDIIHCNLETHSLSSFNPEYLAFLSQQPPSSQGKRTTTSQWVQSRLPPELARVAALSRTHAVQPPESQHRFGWGDYAALSYA